MRINKKGMDGRHRYRICIGKDEHGKPKYKNFYAATARNQMGHKDINVTLGIYTSLDKKFKKKKINLLDGYLSQETG